MLQIVRHCKNKRSLYVIHTGNRFVKHCKNKRSLYVIHTGNRLLNTVRTNVPYTLFLQTTDC